MDAVGNNLFCQLRIGGLGLFERGDDRRVEIGHVQLLPIRHLSDKLAVTQQHRVVTAVKFRRLRHVIKRRRLNHRDPDAGQFLFHRINDVLVAGSVSVENLLVESPIRAVVHAEHDRHHRGFVGKHVAPQA